MDKSNMTRGKKRRQVSNDSHSGVVPLPKLGKDKGKMTLELTWGKFLPVQQKSLTVLVTDV